MKNLPISVVINTKNNSSTIEQTLKSANFTNDIVVVDMGSTDGTLDIVKKYTQNIHSFKDVGFVEPARNDAISHAKYDWVFILDADEEISPQLSKELAKLIEADVDVYDLPRKNIVFDKWLRHAGWWPDYQRRLFKKGHVVWQDTIHSIPQVKGKINKLDPQVAHAIIHHNYQSIEQYIDRLNRYTSIEAKQAGKKVANQSTIIREGFAELFRRFFKEEGFKDQMHGLGVTMLQMFYQIVKELKIWQAQGFEESSESVAIQMKSIISQFKYWYAFYRQKTTTNPIAKIYWRIRMHFRV